MIEFQSQKLNVSKELLKECPKMSLIGILHMLNDTKEFLDEVKKSGHTVPIVFAKPYSKNLQAIEDIKALEIEVGEYEYDVLENTSLLKDTIISEKNKFGGNLILIDVGGYFAKPLAQITKESPDLLPQGVIEVTTFGHKKYLREIENIAVPVFSIARSPIKDVEASFVGESAWFAVDRILREQGISVFGKKVGIVGYGMIGRRVAMTAQSNGAHTTVFDTNSLKMLEARSFKHQVVSTLEELLNSSDIIISSTGGTAIQLNEIFKAKDGIILASAGSKRQEIDKEGLEKEAREIKDIGANITEYILSNGKKVYLLKKGSAVNFLLGSCPDETMDLIYAEIIEACKKILNKSYEVRVINQVDDEARQKIAKMWLSYQG